MSVNAPTHYAQQFSTNIQLLLQQKGSKLRGKVMEGSHVGEAASPVDQIGAIEVTPVTTRFAPMGRVDAPTDRRWVFPLSFELPQLIDSFDMLKILTDPKSKYVENAVAAAGRQIDREIISAFFAASATGKTSSTGTTSFPGGQSIAVNHGASGDVGLTVKKLREARRILMAADLDLDAEELYVAVNALAHDNLLAEAQVISTDFNEKPVLVDGKITRFLGFNFCHTELLGLSSGDTMVPVWAKSGMHLGVWGDVQTDISQRKDLQSLPWQAYVKLTIGATRLEEEKVVRILCNV